MTEHVSVAVKERKRDIFSLPAHKVGMYIPDSPHPIEPSYSYLTLAEIRKPGVQYFENGVVAFTDAKSQIAMQEEMRVPYMGIEATKLHEIYHILRDRASLPQDEVQINRDVAYKMGLSRFPFPSYS